VGRAGRGRSGAERMCRGGKSGLGGCAYPVKADGAGAGA